MIKFVPSSHLLQHSWHFCHGGHVARWKFVETFLCNDFQHYPFLFTLLILNTFFFVFTLFHISSLSRFTLEKRRAHRDLRIYTRIWFISNNFIWTHTWPGPFLLIPTVCNLGVNIVFHQRVLQIRNFKLSNLPLSFLSLVILKRVEE